MRAMMTLSTSTSSFKLLDKKFNLQFENSNYSCTRRSEKNIPFSSLEFFPKTTNSCSLNSKNIKFLKLKTRLQNKKNVSVLNVARNGTKIGISASLLGEGEGREGGEKDVVIIGAGIAGLATALALHKIGLSPLVLEQSESLREGGSALSLWGNAWKALQSLGVAETLREGYTPLTRIEVCSKNGRILREFTIAECLVEPHEVRGVHRFALLSSLAEKLPPGSIRFNTTPISVKGGEREGTTVVELKGGEKLTTKILLGCDGTRSLVANYLGLGSVNYAGYAAFRGVGKFPEGHGMGETIKTVFGEGVRAGLYALTETDVYWFTCFNSPPGLGRRGDKTSFKENALSYIKGWDCGIQEAINRTENDMISRSDITDRWTLPLPGVRWGKGGVTVLGDAAHPMTPNLGQGGCTALEDAVVFARELASCCTIQPRIKSKSTSKSGGSAEGSENVHNVSESGDNSSLMRVLGKPKAIAEALARFDDERIHRTAPITVRSYVIGAALQIPFAPFCFLRDNVLVPVAVRPTSFLNHATYDCGELPEL